MDKEAPLRNIKHREKPPILPKPKVIPDRPRFRIEKRPNQFRDDPPPVNSEPSFELNSPVKANVTQSQDNGSLECLTDNSFESDVLVLTSEPEFVATPSPNKDYEAPVRDAVLEDLPRNEPQEEDRGSIEDDMPKLGNEPFGDNKSDSDGVSLTSFKSLDVSCPDPSYNPSFDSTFDSNNISGDQYNGFFSDSHCNTSKKEKSFLVAKEIATSEKIYVQSLKLIVEDFKEHIASYADSPLISSIEFDKIVSSLPQLLRLHEDLLNDLEERVNISSTSPNIADVIVKKGPFLKLYFSYMTQFENQCAALDDLCIKYPAFSQALHDFEKFEKCKHLTLKHYMLKPVQRLPQYRLLLERYLAQLNESEEEHANARSALNIVQDVLQHANSTIKSTDNLGKLLKLQSRLGNYEIIKPGRSFIKEGELQKLSRKEIQPRYLILFSDCLLYTIYLPTSLYLRMKYELPLAGMRVHRHEETEFDVITSTRSFTLRARNELECTEWIDSLLSAISENNQRQRSFFTMQSMSNSAASDSLKLGKEAPVWIQDKRTTMCQVCTSEFTVTFRRHHCRCCGRVVCGICSNNKAPLQYLKFHAKRVCDECFDLLFKDVEDVKSTTFKRYRQELGIPDATMETAFFEFKSLFKKFDGSRKFKKIVPQRLKEVPASDSGSQMSGWLDTKGKRGWRRLWFVLKDQVLYSYKASHDVMAYRTLPVLGYTVDQPLDSVDDFDKSVLFRLTHSGQQPLIFSAPSEHSAKIWISVLRNATILN